MVAPALQVLHIDGIDEIAEFLTTLVGQGLPDHWRELVCSGRCSDEAALLEAVEGCRESLVALERLLLPLGDLSKKTVAAIRAIVPQVEDSATVSKRLSSDCYSDW
jgi:hypothetical protein